jgi:hypothetical protein
MIEKPIRHVLRLHRTPVRSAPSLRRSNYAHSKKNKLRLWLVGFVCHNHRSGCRCNTDVPKRVKNDFKRRFGFDYDAFCHYETIQAPEKSNAQKLAWEQITNGTIVQPAGVWADSDVIGLAPKYTAYCRRRKIPSKIQGYDDRFLQYSLQRKSKFE